jgi:hypothetical protein
VWGPAGRDAAWAKERIVAIDVYKEWLGIPEGPRPPDHYALLRLVMFEDDVEKIRKNYKKLNGHVRKYATGQYSDESQALLNELAKAMLCLTDVELKREYDRGLGREIDDRDAKTGRRPLTAYLMDEGAISSSQAKEAQNHAERTGLSLRDAVVQLKYASAEQAARAYANELGLAYVDVADMIPDEAALDGLPKNLVKRYTCLPLFLSNERLLLACSDEPSHELEEEVRLRLGVPLKPVLAAPNAIRDGVDRYYAEGMRKEVAAAKSSSSAKSGATSKLVEKVVASKPAAELTEAEREERKKLGIVLACGTFIVLANLDNWVLWKAVWRHLGVPDIFPFVSTILLGGPIIAGLYFSMIRGKK